MAGIFISYRRDDAGPEARRLAERLAARFGADSVFIDVVTLAPGDSFASAIQQKLVFCDALIAVIGPGWLDIRTADGRRRLDDPDDWVRLEIAAALREGVRVIPALVRGAVVPDVQRLPAPLAALPSGQAIDIRARHFDADVDRLAKTLQRYGTRGNIAALWLALLSRRHRALDPLALERPEMRWRALGFLALTVLVGELLRVPALAGMGLPVWQGGFLVAAVIGQAIEWLTMGAALHLGMRALGGRASLQTTMVAFCFLSAWLPLIALSQAPVWGLRVSVTRDMAEALWTPGLAVERITQFLAGLNAFGVIRVLVAFALATGLWLGVAASVATALRTLHGLRGVRAIAGLALGLAAGSLLLGVVYAPLLGAMYAGFGLRPR